MAQRSRSPGVADALRRVVRGAVYDDARRRAEYSADASNYRVVPQAVVEPADADDVLAALDLCREQGVPVTSRGGGTSIAGNSIGTGVVLDFSKHLNRVLEVDADARTAVVEPGVVLSTLQEQLRPHGLRFGPDPSSQSRATLGGMIGNNACGAHAVAFGRTADNVESLTVVDGRGRTLLAGKGLAAVPGLAELVDANLDILRTELAKFPRQGSGYFFEHFLPERGQHLARGLVGSEGTLGVTVAATLRLVPIVPARTLVVLGYDDMPSAADVVPPVLEHRPLAVEGLDSRLVDVLRRHRGDAAIPLLPKGSAWLMVEVGGPDEDAARQVADGLVRAVGAGDSLVVAAGAQADALWRIREDASGLAGRSVGGRPAWPGWEDAAVPPAQLGSYLRGFDALLAAHGLHGLPYGHFGDGCVHVRIDFPLEREPERLRRFVLDAAELVIANGGSCSGEHGDGRARSELTALMYSPRMLDLFAAVKGLLDPDDVLNPGVLVRPRRLDEDLRRPLARPVPAAGGFAFAADGGDLTRAVHRCVGVGKCRADNSAAGGFMCPSYLATRDEKDVTRGRARVLQEVTNGSLVRGWDSAEVHESLDLCLACKACAADCPAAVDMATYKAEVLYRTYRRRLRPASHYSLGQLPRWLRLVDRTRSAPLANLALRTPGLRSALLAAAGVDLRRRPPALATQSFRRSWQGTGGIGGGRRVVLWVDSFTDALSPDVARAAVAVMTSAGYDVVVPDRPACCGLSWVTTGQLDGARRRLRRLLDTLSPYVEQGLPFVGLEPSCTAVLRSDLVELLPDDPRAAALAGRVRTLAESLLATGDRAPAWRPPDLSGQEVLVQPHCHQHAVLGFEADRDLLARTGASVTTLAGCCGLAGNFGMERGHYDVSVAVAETSLLPALRASPRATVVADGFSCRTQARDLAGRDSVHVAQLLARGLGL